MADIICPTFGKPKPNDPNASDWLPMEVVGQAAGYDAGLIRVVIGPTGGGAIQAVALIPDDPTRPDDALNCAIAALRTLEVVSGDRGPKAS